MADWPTPSPSPTATGVFVNHSNGHVTTELIPYNNPYQHMQYNTYPDGYHEQRSNGYAMSAQPCIYDTHSNSIRTYNPNGANLHRSLPVAPGVNYGSSPSNGHVKWGMRAALRSERPSPQGINLFDMLAQKSQQQRNSCNRGRRGSGVRRGSKSATGLVNTLTALQQSASSNHVRTLNTAVVCM